MKIDPDTCIGCEQCIPYCPMGAIHLTDEEVSEIDRDECVECGVCLRSADCPTDAILETENPWPRSEWCFPTTASVSPSGVTPSSATGVSWTR